MIRDSIKKAIRDRIVRNTQQAKYWNDQVDMALKSNTSRRATCKNLAQMSQTRVLEAEEILRLFERPEPGT